jgi:hypothetical protein
MHMKEALINKGLSITSMSRSAIPRFLAGQDLPASQQNSGQGIRAGSVLLT